MAAYLEIPDLSLKVELSSVSLPVNSAMGGGASGGRSGALKPSDMVVSRAVDKYSPILYRDAIQGKGRQMNIYLTDKVGNTVKTYLTVKLENCMITSYSSSNSPQPMEQMSLNFTKAEFSYDPI
jgi:type VI protein secretion system component Hcp